MGAWRGGGVVRIVAFIVWAAARFADEGIIDKIKPT
jgi:hypothetical protein